MDNPRRRRPVWQTRWIGQSSIAPRVNRPGTSGRSQERDIIAERDRARSRLDELRSTEKGRDSPDPVDQHRQTLLLDPDSEMHRSGHPSSEIRTIDSCQTPTGREKAVLEQTSGNPDHSFLNREPSEAERSIR
jgi:hypothetical protein